MACKDKEKILSVFKTIMYPYLKIIRPLNTLIAALSVFIAAFLSVNFHFSTQLALAMLVVAFVTAGANVINDVFDFDIDRINRPSRILPAGRMTVNRARLYYYVLNATALVLGLWLTPMLETIAALAIVTLYIYSRYWKKMVLIGNMSVALISAITFLYGALAVNDIRAGLYPAIFAFFFHFGREVIKDMQDVNGDVQNGAITFVGKYGNRRALILINVVFFLLICFLFLPFLQNIYNIYYIYVVVPGVAAVLIVLAVYIWNFRTAAALSLASMILKIDMLIGLIAIYAGGKL